MMVLEEMGKTTRERMLLYYWQDFLLSVRKDDIIGNWQHKDKTAGPSPSTSSNTEEKINSSNYLSFLGSSMSSLHEILTLLQ